jgi:hypothetical protein
MITSPLKKIWFDEQTLWLELNDARILGTPLAWFPRLVEASKQDLEKYELSPFGIHWEHLNEDISVDGLLLGFGDQTHYPEKVI